MHFFFKEVDTCNTPPSEKRARYSEGVLMQATRPSVIKFATRTTQDQPMPANLLMTGTSDPRVSSISAGRNLKREWTALYNASAPPTEDCGLNPPQVLPRSSDIEVQSEFVSIYIIFLFLSLFSKIR
jgi:hypothetical protein